MAVPAKAGNAYPVPIGQNVRQISGCTGVFREREGHHGAPPAASIGWRKMLKTGRPDMSAIVAPKSRTMNWLEGVTLSAILQGLPTFTGAALLLKLAGSGQIVGQTGGKLRSSSSRRRSSMG